MILNGDMHAGTNISAAFQDVVSAGAPSSELGALRQTFLGADQLFEADVPELNASGVSGKVLLALKGETLTVLAAAGGLDPNQIHPIHIHGFPTGTPDAHTPGLDDDADHDHFVEVAEGAHDYGPILLSLKDDGAFPTAPDGTFLFTETYQLPTDFHPGPVPVLNELGLTDEVALDRREIVIHGLTLPNSLGLGGTNENSVPPNEADGTPGYKIALPVASGEIDALAFANDTLQGGTDADLVNGGRGNDLLRGGSNNDSVNGGQGHDLLYGQAGDDVLNGGAGMDLLSGGVGNDTLRGGADDDALLGGSGNDLLSGQEGNDTVSGGSGADTVWGNEGNDLLSGDAGNDLIRGGSGNDTMSGGAGEDVFFFGASDLGSDRIEDFRLGTDHLSLHGWGLNTTQDVLAATHDVDGVATISMGESSITLAHITTAQLQAQGDFVV